MDYNEKKKIKRHANSAIIFSGVSYLFIALSFISLFNFLPITAEQGIGMALIGIFFFLVSIAHRAEVWLSIVTLTTEVTVEIATKTITDQLDNLKD